MSESGLTGLIVFAGLLLFAFWGLWRRERRVEQALIAGQRLAETYKASQPESFFETYKGSQPQAIRRFQADAIEMASKGYFPTSQSWAPGQWGAGAYIVAVLLIFLFGLGILILGYMLIVKPDGTLTVTYERRAEEKTCPMCAERIKAAALVCHYCGHTFAPAEVQAHVTTVSPGV
jgi:hypothetical protein